MWQPIFPPERPLLVVLLAFCLAGLAPPATAYSGKIKETTRYQRNDQHYAQPAPVVIQYTQNPVAPPLAFNLAANGLYAAYLNQANRLSFTGINDQGQFGNGSTNTSNNNQWAASGLSAQSVAVGEQTTLVLTGSGDPMGAGYVRGAGANDDGDIGIGNQTAQVLNFTYAVSDTASPLAGAKLHGIIQVATGREHSIALDSSNRIWVAGDNDHGQLGFDPNGTPQLQCSKTTGDMSVLTCIDTWRVSMTGLPVGAKVLSIGAGGDISLALVYNPSTRKNELYGTGSNVIGQLGQGDTSDRYQWTLIWPDVMTPTNGLSFAAGWWHLLFLDASGILHGTGDNSCGQLGFGPGDPACNNDRPDYNPGNPGAMLTSQYVLSPVTIPLDSGASPGQGSSIAAGPYTSFVLLANGDLYATGANMTGQLGVGNDNFYEIGFVPVLTDVDSVTGGRYFSLATRRGDVYYTGSIGSASGPDATVPVAGNPPANTWQLSN